MKNERTGSDKVPKEFASRRRHFKPEPIVEMHPDTAESVGLKKE